MYSLGHFLLSFTQRAKAEENHKQKHKEGSRLILLKQPQICLTVAYVYHILFSVSTYLNKTVLGLLEGVFVLQLKKYNLKQMKVTLKNTGCH